MDIKHKVLSKYIGLVGLGVLLAVQCPIKGFNDGSGHLLPFAKYLVELVMVELVVEMDLMDLVLDQDNQDKLRCPSQ